MEKKLNKRDLVNIFIRSNFLLGSFNFERMQAIGFCVSLLPALRKVYKDDKPAMAAAMKRHLEFFNTQPFLATPIMGITAAMEEKKANGADISDQTISGVKVGLMGPLGTGVAIPKTVAWRIPLWTCYASILIGLVSMTYYFFWDWVRATRNLFTGGKAEQ